MEALASTVSTSQSSTERQVYQRSASIDIFSLWFDNRALDPINESSNSILDDDISYDRTEDEDFLNNSAFLGNDSIGTRKSGGKRR